MPHNLKYCQNNVAVDKAKADLCITMYYSGKSHNTIYKDGIDMNVSIYLTKGRKLKAM